MVSITSANTTIINVVWLSLTAAATQTLTPVFNKWREEALQYIKENGICSIFKSYPFYLGSIIVFAISLIVMVDYFELYEEEEINEGLKGFILVGRWIAKVLTTSAIFSHHNIQKRFDIFANKLKNRVQRISKRFTPNLKSAIHAIVYHFIGVLPTNQTLRLNFIYMLTISIIYIICYKCGIKICIRGWVKILFSLIVYCYINFTGNWLSTCKALCIALSIYGIIPVTVFCITWYMINRYIGWNYHRNTEQTWVISLFCGCLSTRIAVWFVTPSTISAVDTAKLCAVELIYSFVTAKMIKGKEENQLHGMQNNIRAKTHVSSRDHFYNINKVKIY